MMENNKMLNSIDVSMFDENDVVNLLLKVIELSNNKVSLLNKKLEEYNSIQKKIKEENTSLKQQVKLKNGKSSQLRSDLDQANNKIKAQGSTITKLSEQIKTLRSELTKSNVSVQKKEKEIDNLSKEKERLQSELTTKNESLKLKDETIQELTNSNNNLNDSLSDANKIIYENKIGVVKIYANIISELLALRKCENSYWDEYLVEICHKISKFIEEATNIENLTLSLKSSNSWLTKIASITWWSKLPTISNIVGKNVPNINELNKVFDDLIQFLINIDITIQLPNCGLCDAIDNYKANLKEKTNFKDLFENSEISEGTLCEIYRLAINGNNGLCLTFNL